MKAITCAMQTQDSGLEVRDRNWLKITIHQAFIGKLSLRGGVMWADSVVFSFYHYISRKYWKVYHKLREEIFFTHFVGAEVVDWLFAKVQGFSDRREANKYARQMLKVS